MDLNATDEQKELRAAAKRFLADAAPPARVAELADSGDWDESTWATIAELGWLGISVPEQLGGVGLGLVEETIVFEEAGAALLPGPLLSTVGLALPALQACGRAEDLVAAIVTGELRATLAWADPDRDASLGAAAATDLRAGGGRLTGTKVSVPDVDRVDYFVVVARDESGPALFGVPADAAGVAVESVDSVDGTATIGNLHLADTAADRLAEGEVAAASLAASRTRALTLAAAEANGLTARVLAESVEYAGEREQFGRKIGTYQGVSHPLADTYVGLELSRSTVIWAALAVDSADAEAELAVAAAAVKAAPTAIRACEVAIQVHGGIGMTWESHLHRCYKRALALGSLDGPGARQRRLLADVLLGAAPAS
jgi:alkylation response protein AidB-like acyl-CoA dehydrogenase